ncbi:MAG: DUF1624 domain-containing protein [Oscillospiraceae bacterium]|nr:DUF1624 domain-containing protein [Oscillospiraceae bacterium]
MKRYQVIDCIRGLAILNMVAYHAMWDIVYILGVKADWYIGAAGIIWQRSICFTFILLSGFCCYMGKHPIRRGAIVFGCGALVTAATLLIMPENRIIFGVLTFIGSAMLIAALLRKWVDKIPPVLGMALSFALLIITWKAEIGFMLDMPVPDRLYANTLTAYLGFPPSDFFSTDYYPLLPWIFLFFAGVFLYRMAEGRMPRFLERSLCRPLEWAGRHSLIIYLLHQPLLMLIFNLLM